MTPRACCRESRSNVCKARSAGDSVDQSYAVKEEAEAKEARRKYLIAASFDRGFSTVIPDQAVRAQ